jgi:hypothetical protein
MESPTNPDSAGPFETPPVNVPSKRFRLHRATCGILGLMSGSLGYANLVCHHQLFGDITGYGWPVEVYSSFFGHESFNYRALFANLLIATLMLAATAWVVETWVRRRFRFGIPSLLGMVVVAGVVACCIYCGIISWANHSMPGEESQFAFGFAGVSQELLGTTLTFDIYGDYWWEYGPYSVLFLGLCLTVYAVGRILLLPLKILSPGPFRWQ